MEKIILTTLTEEQLQLLILNSVEAALRINGLKVQQTEKPKTRLRGKSKKEVSNG